MSLIGQAMSDLPLPRLSSPPQAWADTSACCNASTGQLALDMQQQNMQCCTKKLLVLQLDQLHPSGKSSLINASLSDENQYGAATLHYGPSSFSIAKDQPMIQPPTQPVYLQCGPAACHLKRTCMLVMSCLMASWHTRSLRNLGSALWNSEFSIVYNLRCGVTMLHCSQRDVHHFTLQACTAGYACMRLCTCN